MTITKADIEALDRQDPLRGHVAAFHRPDGLIYLNGNSLGQAPQAAIARASKVASGEWAEMLVTGWNRAGWWDLPRRLGDLLAGLVGAAPGELVVADGTSLNLHKVVATALAMQPDRRTIVMAGSDFPTDVYVVQGLIAQLGQGHTIRFAEADALDAALAPDVAVVILSDVHFKTARILDMAAITARAHAAGALIVWDLCHSAGAIPVDLNRSKADFAVGCTYKYLNGGPGSPGFLFAAARHHARMQQPLTGWWGHAEPFAFQRDFQPASGISRMLCGTQPILSMAVAEAGIALALSAGADAARAKSQALGALFLALLAEQLPQSGLLLSSPADASQRGGHVALDHPHGLAIMQALIAAGVVGDFRAPCTLRFGFSPLPLRYADIREAVARLATVMRDKVWQDSRYARRDAVT